MSLLGGTTDPRQELHSLPGHLIDYVGGDDRVIEDPLSAREVCRASLQDVWDVLNLTTEDAEVVLGLANGIQVSSGRGELSYA